MSLLNENQIKTIFEIDRSGELYSRLLSIFETDIPKLISDLESALKSEDYVNAKKISHSIKSSSLNMGATELSILAGELENSEQNLKYDFEAVMELRKCFDYTVIELKGNLNLCNKDR